jgi:hypothetical protein
MTLPINPLEVLEDLIDDDPFIRSYPFFKKYMRDWDELGGESACKVPEEIIFEFYAEKLPVEEALQLWYTYDPYEQLTACKYGLR